MLIGFNRTQLLRALGIILLLPSVSQADPFVTSYIELQLGQGDSDLDWNIANDMSGQVRPNVLSELEFKRINSQHRTLLAGISMPLINERLYGQIELAYGLDRINSGELIDTDYRNDDRQRIDYQSRSQLSSDDNQDAVIQTNFYWQLWHHSQVFAGLSWRYRDIEYRIRDGIVQDYTLMPLNPIESELVGLDSSYRAVWQGLGKHIGIRSNWRQFEFELSYGFEQLSYRGTGNWNLRSTLQHPVSYRHSGDSHDANSWQATFHYRLDSWQLGVDFKQRSWQLRNGLDRLYFTDGSISSTRLNQVNFTEQISSVSLSYHF